MSLIIVSGAHEGLRMCPPPPPQEPHICSTLSAREALLPGLSSYIIKVQSMEFGIEFNPQDTFMLFHPLLISIFSCIFIF